MRGKFFFGLLVTIVDHVLSEIRKFVHGGKKSCNFNKLPVCKMNKFNYFTEKKIL